jgi:hypothetical protein
VGAFSFLFQAEFRIIYFEIPEAIPGDESLLHEWAKETMDIAHASRRK